MERKCIRAQVIQSTGRRYGSEINEPTKSILKAPTVPSCGRYVTYCCNLSYCCRYVTYCSNMSYRSRYVTHCCNMSYAVDRAGHPLFKSSGAAAIRQKSSGAAACRYLNKKVAPLPLLAHKTAAAAAGRCRYFGKISSKRTMAFKYDTQ